MVQQKRVKKGKSFEKRKKGKEGENGLREKSVFLLLCDCIFHPLSIHHTTTPTHSPQSTPPSHTTRHTSTPVCRPLSLCVTLSALIPHSTNTTQHNTMQPCNHHMPQLMDDAMSEWERAVVIEDTTPQTPSTTMK